MPLLTFQGVTFDPDTGVIAGAVASPHRLPRSVGAVFAALMRASGRVVTRETLIDAMWGDRDDGPMPKVLDVVIHRLRCGLAAINAPVHIETEWGVRYRLSDVPGDLWIRCPHCGERLNAGPVHGC